MGWAFFYMFVILKIPIIAALYIVWWAVKDEPAASDDSGGGSGVRHWRDPRHPRPHRPRPPRRGPHADPVPASPQRIRARGTRLQRTHG